MRKNYVVELKDRDTRMDILTEMLITGVQQSKLPCHSTNSKGEMGEALKVLVSTNTQGLSASIIPHLKQEWGNISNGGNSYITAKLPCANNII